LREGLRHCDYLSTGLKLNSRYICVVFNTYPPDDLRYPEIQVYFEYFIFGQDVLIFKVMNKIIMILFYIVDARSRLYDYSLRSNDTFTA
jgi:hypothetical protein